MSTKANSRLVIAVFAAVLIVSACGGSGTSLAATTSGESSAPDARVSASGEAATESPLAELLGLPASDDAMSDYFANLEREAQTKIAECMIGEGFEYQPVDYSQVNNLDDQIDFDTREFAEMYGFGVASNPWEESFEAFQAFEDPNSEYLATLTDGEREAYERALNGDVSFDAEAGSTEIQILEPGGCQGDVYNELFSFGQVFEQFGGELEAVEEAFSADPRILEATAGWGACMSEAGYRLTNAAAAEADVQRRYNAIVNSGDAYESEDDVIANIEAEDGEDVFFFGPGTLKPEFQARVDELAVEERAIATASWDCNAPLREIEADVWLEYERKFVEENGGAIKAALDG